MSLLFISKWITKNVRGANPGDPFAKVYNIYSMYEIMVDQDQEIKVDLDQDGITYTSTEIQKSEEIPQNKHISNMNSKPFFL